MGLVNDLTTHLSGQIEALLPDAALIHDPTRLRPTLAAGKTIVWLGPPEEIIYEGYQQGRARYELAIISPNTADPIKGLDTVVDLARLLHPALTIERVTPDSLTIGNGPAYPAALAIFTIEFQETQ